MKREKENWSLWTGWEGKGEGRGERAGVGEWGIGTKENDRGGKGKREGKGQGFCLG